MKNSVINNSVKIDHFMLYKQKIDSCYIKDSIKIYQLVFYK